MTAVQLATLIEESNVLLVLFKSPTCNKCSFRYNNMMNDETLAKHLVEFDASSDMNVCNELNIVAVPTLICFSNWKEMFRFEEAQPNDVILTKIKETEWIDLNSTLNHEMRQW